MVVTGPNQSALTLGAGPGSSSALTAQIMDGREFGQ